MSEANHEELMEKWRKGYETKCRLCSKLHKTGGDPPPAPDLYHHVDCVNRLEALEQGLDSGCPRCTAEFHNDKNPGAEPKTVPRLHHNNCPNSLKKKQEVLNAYYEAQGTDDGRNQRKSRRARHESLNYGEDEMDENEEIGQQDSGSEDGSLSVLDQDQVGIHKNEKAQIENDEAEYQKEDDDDPLVHKAHTSLGKRSHDSGEDSGKNKQRRQSARSTRDSIQDKSGLPQRRTRTRNLETNYVEINYGDDEEENYLSKSEEESDRHNLKQDQVPKVEHLQLQKEEDAISQEDPLFKQDKYKDGDNTLAPDPGKRSTRRSNRAKADPQEQGIPSAALNNYEEIAPLTEERLREGESVGCRKCASLLKGVDKKTSNHKNNCPNRFDELRAGRNAGCYKCALMLGDYSVKSNGQRSDVHFHLCPNSYLKRGVRRTNPKATPEMRKKLEQAVAADLSTRKHQHTPIKEPRHLLAPALPLPDDENESVLSRSVTHTAHLSAKDIELRRQGASFGCRKCESELLNNSRGALSHLTGCPGMMEDLRLGKEAGCETCIKEFETGNIIASSQHNRTCPNSYTKPIKNMSPKKRPRAFSDDNSVSSHSNASTYENRHIDFDTSSIQIGTDKKQRKLSKDDSRPPQSEQHSTVVGDENEHDMDNIAMKKPGKRRDFSGLDNSIRDMRRMPHIFDADLMKDSSIKDVVVIHPELSSDLTLLSFKPKSDVTLDALLPPYGLLQEAVPFVSLELAFLARTVQLKFIDGNIADAQEFLIRTLVSYRQKATNLRALLSNIEPTQDLQCTPIQTVVVPTQLPRETELHFMAICQCVAGLWSLLAALLEHSESIHFFDTNDISDDLVKNLLGSLQTISNHMIEIDQNLFEKNGANFAATDAMTEKNNDIIKQCNTIKNETETIESYVSCDKANKSIQQEAHSVKCITSGTEDSESKSVGNEQGNARAAGDEHLHVNDGVNETPAGLQEQSEERAGGKNGKIRTAGHEQDEDLACGHGPAEDRAGETPANKSDHGASSLVHGDLISDGNDQGESHINDSDGSKLMDAIAASNVENMNSDETKKEVIPFREQMSISKESRPDCEDPARLTAITYETSLVAKTNQNDTARVDQKIDRSSEMVQIDKKQASLAAYAVFQKASTCPYANRVAQTWVSWCRFVEKCSYRDELDFLTPRQVCLRGVIAVTNNGSEDAGKTGTSSETWGKAFSSMLDEEKARLESERAMESNETSIQYAGLDDFWTERVAEDIQSEILLFMKGKGKKDSSSRQTKKGSSDKQPQAPHFHASPGKPASNSKPSNHYSVIKGKEPFDVNCPRVAITGPEDLENATRYLVDLFSFYYPIPTFSTHLSLSSYESGNPINFGDKSVRMDKVYLACKFCCSIPSNGCHVNGAEHSTKYFFYHLRDECDKIDAESRRGIIYLQSLKDRATARLVFYGDLVRRIQRFLVEQSQASGISTQTIKSTETCHPVSSQKKTSEISN